MLKFHPVKQRYVFPAIAILAAVLVPAQDAASQERSAEDFYLAARRILGRGDSTHALGLLDRAVESEPRHWQALLLRGRLRLALDDKDGARDDLRRALFADDRDVLIEARLSLGDMHRGRLHHNWDAVGEYRQALRHDPDNRRALYSIAMTAFDLGDTEGYRLASETLVRLICLEPDYRDAYDLWRGRIKDQTENEMRTVAGCLEPFIEQHPRYGYRRLDLARDSFRLGEPRQALRLLGLLQADDPDYKPAERLLLRARCLLALGDTTAFEQAYDEALETAAALGGFRRLFLEVQPIMTPEEKEQWYGLHSPRESAVLFRKFWKRRDPDPTTVHNERLIEHYTRLNHAETYYRQLFPHSRFQNSEEYFRLLSPSSSLMEFDPGIFRGEQNRPLPLDQRGMLYVRHGPPKVVSKPDIKQQQDPTEVWYYDDAWFGFERKFGAGDFTFTPLPAQGAGDMAKALQTETFNDPLPALDVEYYAAEFKAPGGGMEIEFYQSAVRPGGAAGKSPAAVAAVFDSTWLELARDNSRARAVGPGPDTLWMAVNRLRVDAGSGFYALKLDIPGRRAVSRKAWRLREYRAGELDLSGLVLGIPSPEGEPLHSRRGIALLPRPSLRFRRGERISVFFEVYGLRAGEHGERSYRENIEVSLEEETGGGAGGLFGALRFWGGGGGSSLTMSFERKPEGASGPVPEYFVIDSSELTPGRYRLEMEITDLVSREEKSVTWLFEIVSSE